MIRVPVQPKQNMVSRQESRKRQQRQQNARLRYERERRRNLLAVPGRHRFVLVLDHLKAGFNIPKIFRSAEAFGAHAIHLVDIPPFDPAPAKGAFRKVPARFHDDFAGAYRELRTAEYTLFSLQADAPDSLATTLLPVNSAFVLGNEGLGLSFAPDRYPDIRPLRIPQVGQMESLNVSIAASIVMYEYLRQHEPETA